MKVLQTKVRATQGVVIGRAFVVDREAESLPYLKGGVEQEQARFSEAVARSVEQIEELALVDEIFAAHLEMVQDDMLREGAEAAIAEGKSAVEAVKEVEQNLVQMFEQIDDEYLRERAADVQDICSRIVANLMGGVKNHFQAVAQGDIIVADNLTPSDMSQIDFGKVGGFVTREGGATSHVCIIARNRSVVAVVGLHDALDCVEHGSLIVVDGTEGRVVVEPDETTLQCYTERMREYLEQRDREREYSHIKIYDRSSRPICVMANAGNVEEVKRAIEAGADGIGLFRSEFLYMQSSSEPSEQEQYEAYAAAARACGELPLTIRTLDIGGDKALPYLPIPKEENPFLGWRAIRISLELRELFMRQLRAILRAGACGNVRVMFPMITCMEELREAKLMLEECKVELDAQNLPFDADMKVGVMIETPAAVFLARELARECDFFSIGTNDLTQYVMAADRSNVKVANLYNPYSKAVLEAVRQTIVAAADADIECGMCGEFASDSQATEMLLGMGVHEFSVNISSIGGIKSRLSELLS